jgi:bifunctional DNA-binding transcriptional regulator/antitoxin component of YhaV-PrlF toxin-antitoxin module
MFRASLMKNATPGRTRTVTTKAETTTHRTYHVKVTGRHAITLPAELCRELGITTGDVIELEIVGQQALLRLAPDEPTPPLQGLLSDYFTGWEDINRLIEEERKGWEEREELLEQMEQPTPEHNDI